MDMLKPIETRYNGYRFRSRIEARWAVFFDTLGIEYRYEPEGFNLGNGVFYLPDFWLPELELWVEIKGASPSHEEIEKAALLAQQGDSPVIIFWSNFDAETEHDSLVYWKDGNGVFHSASGYHFDFDGVEEACLAARQARFEHREVQDEREAFDTQFIPAPERLHRSPGLLSDTTRASGADQSYP
jgi:hypothetical protein